MAERLTAGDVCTRGVATATGSMSVSEAARLMRGQHVGCLVVVESSDQGPCVLGMLTDRDIVTAVVAKDLDCTTLRVGDVMTTDLVTAREEDSLDDLIGLMQRKGVRRVLVTTPQGVLVGLVALDDLLLTLSTQFARLVQAIGGERRHEAEARP